MQFVLYVCPLVLVICSFKGISYQCYTDNIQLNSFKPQNISKLSVLLNCFNSTTDWKADNCPHLNTDKTEVLVSSPDGVVRKVKESLGSLSTSVKPALCNVGISLGQDLSLHQHVNCLVLSTR